MKLIAATLTLAFAALAQQQSAQPGTTKPRVFITSPGAWEAAGNRYGFAGGARPQTAEVYKTFNENCPVVALTNKSENADYVVELDHEGGKGIARRRNKIIVFNKAGDLIFSDSTRSLGNSVKDACKAITGVK